VIDSKVDLFVVTPVYEDTEASSRLFSALAQLHGKRMHLIVVDDGSLANPVTKSLVAAANVDATILSLHRNVGHQKAIAIGLSFLLQHVRDEQKIVVMDSDGEDLPSSIAQLEENLSACVEVAVATRKSRVETIRFKAFYLVYKSFFRLMTGRHISFGNFMMLKASGLRRLVLMPELATHVAASVLASKLRITEVAIDRGPRYAGKSKMNFSSLILHGLRALMVFAEDVLVRATMASVLIATFSALGIATAIFLKSIGFATPGWFSIALGVLLMMLIQTGAVSLMTLMLTGVVRSAAPADIRSYQNLIREEIWVRSASKSPD